MRGRSQEIRHKQARAFMSRNGFYCALFSRVISSVQALPEQLHVVGDTRPRLGKRNQLIRVDIGLNLKRVASP